MKVALHSSAMPDREEARRFCRLHRFLESAFGLPRNDMVVSRLRPPSENVVQTEEATRPTPCHPDRGPIRPEWRDLREIT